MAKAPAFLLYVRDWLGDPALQSCAAATRGIWINALCFMWEAPERGKLAGTKDSLGRLLGATPAEMDQFWSDLDAYKFADVTFCNSNVTLSNRRMVRDEKIRQGTKLRVARHRSNAPCNADVTPPSSSSSSFSCTKVQKNPPTPQHHETPQRAKPAPAARPSDSLGGFGEFWTAYPKKVSKGQAERTWAKLKLAPLMLPVLLAALERSKKSPQWSKDGGRYIPHPSTWLNAKGWEDQEPETADSDSFRAEQEKDAAYEREIAQQRERNREKRQQEREDQERERAWLAEHPEFTPHDTRPFRPCTGPELFANE